MSVNREVTIENIICNILQIHKQKNNVIVALDGPCASGKTSLALYLAERLNVEVLHMDDFFLPPKLRTQERYNTPGGNVHYERFLQEVLVPLSNREEFVYRPFDCKNMSYKDAVMKTPGDITIVEGSYSCHPALCEFYDLKIFLDVTPDVQMSRIILRNGHEIASDFINKWIPLENRYFLEYDIKSKADIVIEYKEK